MPIFYGKATKAINFLQDKDKEYIARFKLGVKTDTKDITGEILKEEESSVLKEELEKVLELFVGKIFQIPPMYSAVKVSGVALYKLARKGEVVERKEREVLIYSLKCLEFDEKKQEGVLKVFCSSGTYIRTLVEDIALKLGTYGVLLELERTKACGFSIEESLKIEEVKRLQQEEKLEKYIKTIDEIFKDLGEINLNLKEQEKFLNGVMLKINDLKKFKEKEMVRVYGEKFLGLAHNENGFLKIDRIFSD